MTKRLLDVVLASVALIALAPVLAVAALGIRLSSRGPILYRARLVGLCGRRFVMYKLRTMPTLVRRRDGRRHHHLRPGIPAPPPHLRAAARAARRTTPPPPAGTPTAATPPSTF